MNASRLFLLSGMLVVFSACAGISEIEDPEAGYVREEVIIRASHEYDGQTKTVLQEDGSVWWKPNDAIGVFFGTYCSWFYSYNMEDAPSANFIGEALIVTGHNENSAGSSDVPVYWGVFPPDLTNDYNGDEEFDYYEGNAGYEEPERQGESVNVYLPERQRGVAGTFDSNYFISIARSLDYKELSFYNLCGGLAFSVSEEGIHTVTFKANGGQTIAGGVNAVMNDSGRPVVDKVLNGRDEVTMALNEGESFVPGEWYYIVMLPAVLSDGYTMTFYKERERAVRTTDSSVEIKRSVFGKLTNPDSGLEWETHIPAESVEIQPDYSVISIGETLQLTAVVSPADCPETVEWTSGNPDVATVDQNGLVTAVAAGEVRITAKVGNVSEYVTLYVSDYYEPSFELVSVGIADAHAVMLMEDETLGEGCIYTIDEDGKRSRMTIVIETDDTGFAEYVSENVGLSYSRAVLMADEYVAFEDLRFVYDYGAAPESYRSALVNYNFSAFSIIRISDGMVMEFNARRDNMVTDTRKSHDGNSIYSYTENSSTPVSIFSISGNSITQNIPFDFSGSSFLIDAGAEMMLDADNNILAVESDSYFWFPQGYVLCSDNSIVPVTDPDDIDVDLFKCFGEYGYNWYCVYANRQESSTSVMLYKLEVSDGNIVWEKVISGESSNESYDFGGNFYRRENYMIFQCPSEEVGCIVVDLSAEEIKFVSYSDYPSEFEATDDGYGYSLVDGVLSSFDLATGQVTSITCDRSNVPGMTPADPVYDSVNNCFHESGTRLSDSKTVTVVTDCITGKVTVYEGGYDEVFGDSYLKLK